VGFAELLPDGSVANSAACIDRDGTLAGVYRKTQLFAAERKVFWPGDKLRVVRLAGLPVAPLICFDVEFPEPVRALALAGAELLVTASANMEPYGDDHEVATRARSLENHLPHLYSNAVGIVRSHRFVGRSRSVGAAGEVLAQAGSGEELLVAPVGPAGAACEHVDYLRQLPEELPVVVQQPRVG
jgi:predicted amidohydrolase